MLTECCAPVFSVFLLLIYGLVKARIRKLSASSREASINRQTANDRAANGGKLTAQEHQQINQRQNNVSKSINNDKHNANTQAHPHAEGGGKEPKK